MKFLIASLFIMISLSVHAERGLWVWSNESYHKGSVIFDTKEELSLTSVIKANKIQTIYLDMQQIIKDESHLEAFISFATRMKNQKVEIELLIGRAQWSRRVEFLNFNLVLKKD